MTTWVDIIDHIGSAAVYASIAPALLGGVLSFFKQWIPSEEEIIKKIDFAKSQLRTEIELSLRRVLNEFMSFEMDEKPSSETEAFPSYSKQHMATVRIIHCFESVRRNIAVGYTLLFVTAIIAVFLILVALLITVLRPYITIFAVLIIVTQIYSICRMFHAKRTLYQEIRDL